MPVLTRDALEDSPLADLHLIAAETGLDGFRKLRKADLVDAILERQGGAPDAEADAEPDADDAPKPARRGRRGGRGRSRDADRGDAVGADADTTDAELSGDAEPDDAVSDDAPAEADAPAPRGRGRADDDEDGAPRRRSRGGRGRGRDRDAEDEGGDSAREPREERVAEGVVELLGNGSGFLRVSPPDASDDDVYISAAQVRRCELVSGDTIAGPVRPPRRSERYPSLQRIDTINGRPADEVAEGTPFDELPATLPSARFALGSEDPTLKAIEWLTPLGRGSRVTITGSARAGKTEALRRLAGALAGAEELEVTLVLAGVRPEELSGAPEGLEPAARLSFAASTDARAQAVERAVETARRVAARGGHAVVLIDTLDGLPESAARRALASARAIVDGGSLTVIATASQPLGGETTVIALDVDLTATGRLPALDLVASGTLRPELLVGDAGAEAIAQARASALGA
jgi:transcription termination factor Rho